MPSTSGSCPLVPGRQLEAEGLLPSTGAVSVAPGVCVNVSSVLGRWLTALSEPSKGGRPRVFAREVDSLALGKEVSVLCVFSVPCCVSIGVLCIYRVGAAPDAGRGQDVVPYFPAVTVPSQLWRRSLSFNVKPSSYRELSPALRAEQADSLSFDVALFSGPFCAALDSSQLTLESDPEFLDSTWSVTSSRVSILVLVRASR